MRDRRFLRTTSGAAAALFFALFAAACASSPKAAPQAAASAAPDTDPETQLANAERELDRALGLGDAGALGGPSKNGTQPSAPSADMPGGDTGGVCATACNALASMSRATDRLCGIAGEDDPRCSSARSRVKNATAQVNATCPSCSN